MAPTSWTSPQEQPDRSSSRAASPDRSGRSQSPSRRLSPRRTGFVLAAVAGSWSRIGSSALPLAGAHFGIAPSGAGGLHPPSCSVVASHRKLNESPRCRDDDPTGSSGQDVPARWKLGADKHQAKCRRQQPLPESDGGVLRGLGISIARTRTHPFMVTYPAEALLGHSLRQSESTVEEHQVRARRLGHRALSSGDTTHLSHTDGSRAADHSGIE